MQQMISALEAVALCGICSSTMKQPSTLSTCSHTFCLGCIENTIRITGCCPDCQLPTWRRDIRASRKVGNILMHANMQ
jgi:hypothetical protein